jgi:hypothetical protein
MSTSTRRALRQMKEMNLNATIPYLKLCFKDVFDHHEGQSKV